MSRPGIPGTYRRRLVAGAVASVGVLDVVLAAVRDPVLRVGPLHNAFHFTLIHGSRYLLLASALALIASASGLLHGKRHAWHIALAAALVTLIAHSFKRADAAGAGLTVALIVLLLATRAAFPARSDPLRARQGLAWLLLGGLGVFLYGVAGLYLLDRDFRQPTELGESIQQAARLLFLQPSTTIEPITRHGHWFINSVRGMALVVLAVSVWHFLHPVAHRLKSGRAERERVRLLLERYATSTLAYFHLLDDKEYYFAEDGRAFIGYRLAGSTAVALGEPIGEPGSCREVARSFAAFCDLNGWSFCFHQVTEAGSQILTATGLSRLKLGEEAVIPLDTFSLNGKSFKHIRNAVNRLQRDGYTVELLPFPVSGDDLDQLQEVSRLWLAEGHHRERGFTLGSFSRAYMQETEVVAVRSPGGRIEAFANIVPAYRSPYGNIDLMRRRSDAPEGVMDFLFVELTELFKERGFSGMSLGFAPLANVVGGGAIPRALRLFYERGNRVFNFKGLRTFKEKWHPEWEPRYLVYRSELQLPQLAVAIARVGERAGHAPWSFRRRSPTSDGDAAPAAPHLGAPQTGDARYSGL